MKRLATALLFLMLFGPALGSSARVSAGDPAMNAFWDKFKAAVIKGNKEAVFALSALPVTMEYLMPDVRTKAQFMKHYKHIFAGDADAAKCFQTAKPWIDRSSKKEFTVGCGWAKGRRPADQPFEYTFKRTAAGWRFVGYDNINE